MIFGDDIEIIGLKDNFVEEAHDLRYGGEEKLRLILGTLTFNNEGKTPCQVECSAHWFVTGALSKVPDYTPEDTVPGVWIGANKPLICAAAARPANFSNAQRADILAGKLPLYLISKIVYESVFGGKHTVRTVYHYRPEAKGYWFAAEDVPAYWEYT